MLDVLSSIVSAVCVVVVVILMVSVSAIIVITLKRSTDAENVLASNRLNRSFIPDLLKTSFFPQQLIKWITIPYNPAVMSDGLVNIENIVVTRGGIMVISTLNVSGYIDNPAHNNWIEYANGHITPMRNPMELNEANARAVRNLLRAEKLMNIRVHNILVYPDPQTQFKYRSESVVPADALIPYIRDLSKMKFIPWFEVKKVTDTIRKYRVRRNGTRKRL